MSAGKKPGIEGSDPFGDRPDGALTPEQVATLEGWVREVAPLLGLHGWRLFVSTHEASEDASASSSVRVNSDEAWVAVERGHPQVSERRRRATITHELLHCHLQQLIQPLRDVLADDLGARLEEGVVAYAQDLEERTIERIAWAISERLPPCPDL